jgi:hypothetical protein
MQYTLRGYEAKCIYRRSCRTAALSRSQYGGCQPVAMLGVRSAGAVAVAAVVGCRHHDFLERARHAPTGHRSFIRRPSVTRPKRQSRSAANSAGGRPHRSAGRGLSDVYLERIPEADRRGVCHAHGPLKTWDEVTLQCLLEVAAHWHRRRAPSPDQHDE